MASHHRIGVVTVTYNSAEVLPEFLRSLAAQTHTDFLLFAVDNASQDATLDLLKQWSDPRLRILANPDNRGIAEGNNQGISAALDAGCDSVLLLNNDTSFGPELIEALDDGLLRHSADMTCPKMLYYDDPQCIWWAGGGFTRWMGHLSRHFGEGSIDRGQFDTARWVTFVPACCVLIRKEVFARVGLMDANYFVYSDDEDFMYRAMKQRMKILYLPSIRLLHKIGALTGGEASPFSIRYGTRNRIYFQIKHFGMARTLPWLVLRRLIWWTKLMLKRNSKEWYDIKLAAYREGIQMGKNYRDINMPS